MVYVDSARAQFEIKSKFTQLKANSTKMYIEISSIFLDEKGLIWLNTFHRNSLFLFTKECNF